MEFQFHKHYTLEEARALLPQIRQWLRQLLPLRQQLASLEKKLGGLGKPGCDLGGEMVNARFKAIAGMQTVLHEFERHEIQIKDLDRGLLDFPALMGNKEVFLCWEQDEDDIEFWHDLESGYAGRERL